MNWGNCDGPDWRPIETAPKDGTDVLLLFTGLKRAVHIGSYDISEHIRNGKSDYRSEGWSIGSMWGFGTNPNPTHWMPLPPDSP